MRGDFPYGGNVCREYLRLPRWFKIQSLLCTAISCEHVVTS